MTTETSNIDDLLMGQKTNEHPETPENMALDYNDNNEVEQEAPESNQDEYDILKPNNDEESQAEQEQEQTEETPETDEYGNETPPENDVIRERLARQAKRYEAELAALKAQLNQAEIKKLEKATQGFEYNPNDEGNWQQQLAEFVKQTVTNMTVEQQQKQRQQQEMQAQVEFEAKFRDDMQRFPDFQETIVGLGVDIPDPIVYATRSMKNPAAFLYAAAKREPETLAKIAKLSDPYAQIAAIGALDERLKKTRPQTQSPRPISRVPEDGTVKVKPKQKEEESIEELIAKADAKRRAQLAARRGRG